MKIIFMGSQHFSAKLLLYLLGQKNLEIVEIFTREAKPKGRGRKLEITPVQEIAEKNRIAIRTPQTLKGYEFEQSIDLIVVVAYGLILPQNVLNFPKYGCINVHPSLLPRWRGAAPVRRAIMSGDKETGICIMQMDAGLDTGPVLERRAIPVQSDDDFDSLMAKLLELSKDTLLEVIQNLQSKLDFKESQSNEGITYATKLENDQDFEINLNDNILCMYNKIRGLSDLGVWIKVTNFPKKLKIYKSEIYNQSIEKLALGSLYTFEKKLFLKCIDGILEIKKLQTSGGKIISSKEFLSGNAGLIFNV